MYPVNKTQITALINRYTDEIDRLTQREPQLRSPEVREEINTLKTRIAGLRYFSNKIKYKR